MMMVSVDMITYKHEKYIAQAVEGVLMQETKFEYELIIADDCSPDGTEKIIKDIIANHSKGFRIKYFRHENNIGMNANGIFAVNKCKGKYIAICEGDDYWTDTLKLQKQVDFLENNSEYSLCFHNAMLCYEGKEKLNRPFQNIENREYSGAEILSVWTIPTASVVFRREAYHPIIHADFHYGDIILFLSLAEKGKIFGMIDIMCVYRKHEEGITALSKQNIETTKKYIKHHIAIKNSFNGKYKKIEDHNLSEIYFSLSLDYLKKFNLFFLKYFFKSLMHDSNFVISSVVKRFLI